MLSTAVFGLSTTWLAYCLVTFLSNSRKYNAVPGIRLLLGTHDAFTVIVARILQCPHWIPFYLTPWLRRKEGYTPDLISVVPFLMGDPTYSTGSLDVMKQVLAHDIKSHHTKILNHTLHSVVGDNIVSSAGENWTRHRRAMAPAFNASLFSQITSHATAIYDEMVNAEQWAETDHVTIPNINVLVRKFSLTILSRSVFGFPMAWKSSDTTSPDTTQFGVAINNVANMIIARIMLPHWMFYLPIKALRNAEKSWGVAAKYIQDCVRDRRMGEDKTSETNDLLGRLIAASDDAGRFSLSERDVIADIFTVMFAGHETTSSVISATLGYLAINQKEQQLAVEEIQRMDGSDSTGDLTEKLPHLLACFREALRMYPAAPFMSRIIGEDLPITLDEKVVVLEKGTHLNIDLISAFRNPKTFPEPNAFKPARWYNVPDNGTLLFSTGPRICIGRKFAQISSLSLLSMILREWKLDVGDLKRGETIEEYEERVMGMADMDGTAFSVGPVAVKLTRRVQ